MEKTIIDDIFLGVQEIDGEKVQKIDSKKYLKSNLFHLHIKMFYMEEVSRLGFSGGEYSHQKTMQQEFGRTDDISDFYEYLLDNKED